MQTPLRLTFRHVDRSAALEARARELLGRLLRFDERIVQCHMTIEGPPGDKQNCAPFTVKIDFTLPGAQIHAENLGGNDEEYGDVYVALRAAFDNAKRQLLDMHQRQSNLASRA